jgi:hypothetical protein
MRYRDLHRSKLIHPDILWIAVNVLLHPEDRENYSPVVLVLVDEAIGILNDHLRASDALDHGKCSCR